MTYFTDARDAADESPFPHYDHCLCCGKESTGATVAWDLQLPGTELPMTRVLFHRECAFKMAQGMIVDAWPNRHEGPKARR